MPTDTTRDGSELAIQREDDERAKFEAECVQADTARALDAFRSAVAALKAQQEPGDAD